uniref:(California timema) hypothetical protein n=1 Tax=Timema californicum TaxID=61474 RepID=A0A7R9P451_TIMCA|nr:unnamed protein product [Timema californicum]
MVVLMAILSGSTPGWGTCYPERYWSSTRQLKYSQYRPSLQGSSSAEEFINCVVTPRYPRASPKHVLPYRRLVSEGLTNANTHSRTLVHWNIQKVPEPETASNGTFRISANVPETEVTFKNTSTSTDCVNTPNSSLVTQERHWRHPSHLPFPSTAINKLDHTLPSLDLAKPMWDDWNAASV